MVVLMYNPSTQDMAGGSLFQASLVYIVRKRTVYISWAWQPSTYAQDNVSELRGLQVCYSLLCVFSPWSTTSVTRKLHFHLRVPPVFWSSVAPG